MMLRFCIHLSLLLIAVSGLLAITMSALASTQPMHPALRGFVEGCENVSQPCWYGIVPGVTSAQEADRIIASLPNYVPSWLGHLSPPNHEAPPCQVYYYVRSPQNTVEYLTFNPCSPLQLGDILHLSGLSPRFVQQDCMGLLTIAQGNIQLYLKEFSLDARILMVKITATYIDFDNYYYGSDWHAFASLGYYYGLNPNFISCG
jgi:hypothetical protein